MLIPFNRTTDRYSRTQLGLWEMYGINPKGILHIGGNRGEEAPVYLELGVRKQIWIEANPEMFLLLKQTISNNPDAIAYNFAAGDIDDQLITLHVANNAGQSSSVLQLGTHRQQHPDVHFTKDVQVTMKRIDCLISKDEIVNYDFLNIDVQGFEGQVLTGMGDYLNHFKWAYIEVNNGQVYEGCWEVGQIDIYMSKFGFRRVETKWVGIWGDGLYIK